MKASSKIVAREKCTIKEDMLNDKSGGMSI